MKREIMATEIYNDGGSIRIVNNGNVILVSKIQIKTIDTIRNDVVRLDIGEGALKNIYIKFTDVVAPKGLEDVNQLRDALNNMLQSNIGGGATEVKQDMEIKLLDGILGVLNNIKISITNIGGAGTKLPSRIDESVPNTVYNGFALAGALPSDAVWAIQKITRNRDLIVYEWADGDELNDNVWDSRYEITYLPI